ncbi:DHA2 family efflux MFS transporter permease subunit [Alloscardovia omnicolens]|uniref:DHA2 family efflux MFS transporter permease subunit n=1 Tax=Alloscardovia omnicolens TaxID=419015 RepID=UPI003A609E56
MSTTQQSTRPKVKHPYLVMSSLYAAAFSGMYSETAMNVILPAIGSQFHVSTSLTQWLVVGYMLVIGLVLPFSSILIKHFPVRTLTFAALGAFAAGAIMSALAPNFAILLIGRAVQGIGLGIALPMTFSLLLEIFPPHKLGAAMGMTTLIIMIAPVIGPALAGIIAGSLGWRFVFWSIVLIAAIGGVCAARFLINVYELTKPSVDVLSIILSVLGFGGIVLGAGMASEFGWMSVPVLAAFIIGIASLIWYSMRQIASRTPVLNLRAFGYRDFALGTILVMLNFGITLITMFLLPQFFQNSAQLAVALAGVVMLPGGLFNAVVGVFSGRSYNKLGARIPALIGFAITTIGIILLITQTLVAHPQIPLIIVYHILMMIGIPLAMTPMQTYALSALPRELNPDGSTIMNTLQQVVGAVFTAVATSLLMTGQASYTGTDAAARFSTGTRWGLIMALVVAMLGLCGSFFLRSNTHKETKHASADTDNAADEPLLHSLMKTDVYTIAETDTAMDAIRTLTQHGISGAPVVRADGSLVGFVSDGDILNLVADHVPEFTTFYSAMIESAVLENNATSFSSRVRENMNRPVSEFAHHSVISVDVNDSMAHICEVMVSQHLKKVPVLDSKNNNKMVGILNRSDVLKYVVNHF